ncbi:MAG: M23 family metallopeptidase [Gammaproteobacteria bacterium]|nr:M23 family metallopeptidase [Gammaproteobacteria bacterium]
MKPVGVVLAGLLWAATAVAGNLELSGAIEQGGMMIGRVPAGSEVRLDGETLRVSPDGVFVAGFDRDADPEANLAVVLPDGGVEHRTLSVTQRDYQIQRIDGLPPSQVTPDEEALKRIRREQALIDRARAIDAPRTDFLAGFVRPVDGARISGVFGSQRILNGEPRRPHYGVDYAAPAGTPVKAPAPGTVTLVHGDMFFSGGTIILDHGHGISSVFIHLSRIDVREGDRIARGDVIGAVGATGRATGPHLHWGMNWFGTRLDPQLLLD